MPNVSLVRASFAVRHQPAPKNTLPERTTQSRLPLSKEAICVLYVDLWLNEDMRRNLASFPTQRSVEMWMYQGGQIGCVRSALDSSTAVLLLVRATHALSQCR